MDLYLYLQRRLEIHFEGTPLELSLTKGLFSIFGEQEMVGLSPVNSGHRTFFVSYHSWQRELIPWTLEDLPQLLRPWYQELIYLGDEKEGSTYFLIEVGFRHTFDLCTFLGSKLLTNRGRNPDWD